MPWTSTCRRSALRIDVTTTDGVLTLASSVESHEDIGRPVAIALNTEGVRAVVSTLQLRQTRTPDK